MDCAAGHDRPGRQKRQKQRPCHRSLILNFPWNGKGSRLLAMGCTWRAGRGGGQPFRSRKAAERRSKRSCDSRPARARGSVPAADRPGSAMPERIIAEILKCFRIRWQWQRGNFENPDSVSSRPSPGMPQAPRLQDQGFPPCHQEWGNLTIRPALAAPVLFHWTTPFGFLKQFPDRQRPVTNWHAGC